MARASYYERAQVKRMNRKKEVRRNILLIVASILIIFGLIFLVSSMSTQASDLDHPFTYTYYKSIQIEAGDTLWSLAEEYGDTSVMSTVNYINKLKEINSLTSESIKSGNYLIVPYYSTDFK